MSLMGWAAREVELSNEHNSCDYIRGCNESALKAYQSLIKDEHSGMSINVTKNILCRLIDGLPLTPIEDTPDIWRLIYEVGGIKTYQCIRMSGLFKKEGPDGTVTYSDNNRVSCVDEENGVTFHSSLVSRIYNEMFPITMPYFPKLRQDVIVVREFLYEEGHGDFDTVGILHIEQSCGGNLDIGRYFKETDNGFEEIDCSEFLERYFNRVKGDKKWLNLKSM